MRMKANGCISHAKWCGMPKDALADITPVALDSQYGLSSMHMTSSFDYYIEWDKRHPSGSVELRRSEGLCSACRMKVMVYDLEVVDEAKAIDSYYERSDSENRARSRATQHARSVRNSHGHRSDRAS